MDFQWFKGGRATGSRLEIKISPAGTITLSSALVKQHFDPEGLTEDKKKDAPGVYVVIGYNQSARKIAIKLAKKDDDGARKLSKPAYSKRLQFSAQAFLKSNNLYVTGDKLQPPAKAIPAEWNEREKMAVVSLPK